MMSKQLSQKEKIKICEELVDRDDGYKCFYCKTFFKRIERPVIEHLNNNRSDNKLDNLVLSCQSCNIKKVTDPILQEISDEKLEMNQMEIYLREKDLKKITKTKEEQEVSTEISINTKNFDITENFIHDRIESCNSIEYSDTLDSCVLLCKQKTSHGSHQCVRNYISSITSSVGLYQIVKKNTKKIIVKRTQ